MLKYLCLPSRLTISSDVSQTGPDTISNGHDSRLDNYCVNLNSSCTTLQFPGAWVESNKQGDAKIHLLNLQSRSEPAAKMDVLNNASLLSTLPTKAKFVLFVQVLLFTMR
jgi:hypothetical protein